MQRIVDFLRSDPKKAKETAALHWSMLAANIAYEGVEFTEQPDFVMTYRGRSIGVEITEAHRSGSNGRNARQIEAAQEQFGRQILNQVKTLMPVEIGLCFEDNIEVDWGECRGAIDEIVSLINQTAAQMKPRSVVLLVRDLADMPHSEQPKRVFRKMPKFLQHMQLFNDGHKTTSVTSWRGISPPLFTQEYLDAILASKEVSLSKYRPCDEQWLVIVSGEVPPIVMPAERPVAKFASLATDFCTYDLDIPIKTKFDRVYFFRSPSEASLLTG